MNANSLDQVRAATGPREVRDDRMEQVRQLLVGDHLRDMEARMTSLEQKLFELDGSVARKLDAVSARIDALASQLDYDRRAAFSELSQGVLELSERLRAVSKGSAI
ncbi:MAG: hypothetical protein ABL894_08030 [Hyphomicrobium sp.]